MADPNLLQRFSRKKVDTDRMANEVIGRRKLLAQILDGLSADRAAVRYGCLKVLRTISEREPAILYPEIKRFFLLLDSEQKILRWGAILIVGNLAAVDAKGKINRILEKYLAPIPGPDLITACNVVGGAAEIALAKPRLADRIVDEILKVEKGRYPTKECRNVAAAQAIETLSRLFGKTKRKRRVVAFVKRHLTNSRPGTRKKAERFVKQWLSP